MIGTGLEAASILRSVVSVAGSGDHAIIRFLMRFFDWGTIAIYLLAITWFGARFRKTQHSLKDYFLGGHAAPWWAIALSIVSAETSTLTVIGTPVLAFNGNFQFLQLILGYLARADRDLVPVPSAVFPRRDVHRL